MAEDLQVKIGIDTSAYLAGVDRVGQANQNLFQNLGRVANDASSYIRRAYSVMDRLDISTLAVSQSAERYKSAQSELNSAVAQFGAGSQQAVKAQQDLEAASKAVEEAQRRQHASQVLVVADIAAMAGKLPNTIMRLQGLGLAAREAAAGMTTAELAGGALLTTVGGVAAVLAGMAAFDAYQDGMKRGATATEELAMAQQNLEEHPMPSSWGIFDGLKETVGVINGPLKSSTEEYESALKRLDQAEAAVAAERTAETIREQQAALQDAAAAAEKVAEAEASARTELSGLGIEMQSLGPAMLQSISDLGPAFAGLAQQIGGARDAELALAKHIIASGNPALLAQMHITKNKSDTTESLAEALGVTVDQEKAMEEQGIITTSIIDRQSAAMSALSASQTASSSFGPSMDPLARLLQDNAASIVGQLYGKPANSYWVQQNAGKFAGDAGEISAILSGTANPDMHDESYMRAMNWLGGAGGSQRNKLTSILEQLTMGLPSQSWDSILSRIGIKGVSQQGTGAASSTVIFQEGSIVVSGGKADDLLRQLQRLGVKA